MSAKPPTFSVIIPTYARPLQLAACLQSLANLDDSGERFEVIVVDDGSATPPQAVVASFQDRLDVTLLRQAHAGPAAARNAGAAQARGNFLAFTDDDCMPAPDWLQTLTARFATLSGHLIGGRRLNALPDNPYSTTSHMLTDFAYVYFNDTRAGFLSSSNLALPTDRFRALGGFDTDFLTSEDREFCDRWLHHGYRMTYASEVLVYHAHAMTLHSLWQQRFRFGCGAFRFHQTRARRGASPFRPDLKFYFHLLRYPFSQVRGRRAMLLVALLVLAQGANAAGFLREGLHRRPERSG
jgi:glycosyltransferase involved in cell wall biosynthesis